MGTETVQHGYMELASPSLEHPVLRFADRIAAALDDVADVDPLYLPTPDKAAALVRLAETSVELPTGPARRLAVKGQGLGFFVNSAIADDVKAGRLVEIAPADFEPLHRDTAMVVRSTAALERDMLADFIGEIARECESVGVILDNRLDTLKGVA